MRTAPGGELKEGEIPIEATVWDRGETFEADGTVRQLICDYLNGMRITRTILAAAICTLNRDAV